MINKKGPYVIHNGRSESLGLRFCDYQFWLSPNGDLVLDPEINEDKVDDRFVVGGSYVLTRTKRGNLAFSKLSKPYSIVPYPPMETDTEWPYGK
jgi:hypothetical protein